MLLINVVKKVKARRSEAIVEHNVHVRVLNVHILGPHVHVYVLKNTGHNLSLVSLKKMDWTHTFGTHCISLYIGPLFQGSMRNILL